MAIDCEGCIYLGSYYNPTNKNVRYRCAVNVSNTDYRLTDWCVEHFAGHTTKKAQPKLSNGFAYLWACGALRAKAILEGCLPYLIIKREQALTAIEFLNTFRHNGATWTHDGTRRGLKADRIAPEILDKREELVQRCKSLKHFYGLHTMQDLREFLNAD